MPICAAGLLLLSSVAAAAPPGLDVGRPPAVLQVDADHLSYHRGKRTIVLRGHVSVRGGALSIAAHHIVLRLDPKGNPLLVHATGGVRIKLSGARGTARRLTVVVGKTLELMDGAALHLDQPRLSLAGQRIMLELDSGRLTVDRARMSLGQEPREGRDG